MISRPLLSIITPCLNRAQFISEAIESALLQDYSSVEHLIIDGGSTDGTLEIVEGYPGLIVRSERDQGVYDAINKGIGMAHGDIIGLLNTDDVYEPNIFGLVVQRLFQNPTAEALLGGVTVFDEINGRRKTVATYPPYPQSEFLPQVSLGMPLFNGWFFRRRLFDRFGAFDIHYRYAADRDWLISVALQATPYTCLERTLYHYRRHGGSLTFNPALNAGSEVVYEFRAIAEKYLARADLANEAKHCFQSWHSQIISDQVLLNVQQRQVRRAIQHARRGWRYNRRWPWIFLNSARRSARGIAQRVLRRLRGSSVDNASSLEHAEN